MSSAVIPKRKLFTSAELVELRSLNLPETDGKPMDSDWQRLCMNLLLEVARYLFRRKKTGYFAGNLCVYYTLEQALNIDFLGPDFFYVKGADPHKLREKWKVWEENNRFPNVIIELLSPSTKRQDLGKKKKIYEQTFQTNEYFTFDPLDRKLSGWRLSPLTNQYESIESDAAGRMYCEELKLWVGPWRGSIDGFKTTWLRFFHDDGGLVLRPVEAALAEKEVERAEKEVERAAKDAALAEIQRLQKLLESQ